MPHGPAAPRTARRAADPRRRRARMAAATAVRAAHGPTRMTGRGRRRRTTRPKTRMCRHRRGRIADGPVGEPARAAKAPMTARLEGRPGPGPHVPNWQAWMRKTRNLRTAARAISGLGRVVAAVLISAQGRRQPSGKSGNRRLWGGHVGGNSIGGGGGGVGKSLSRGGRPWARDHLT